MAHCLRSYRDFLASANRVLREVGEYDRRRNASGLLNFGADSGWEIVRNTSFHQAYRRALTARIFDATSTEADEAEIRTIVDQFVGYYTSRHLDTEFLRWCKSRVLREPRLQGFKRAYALHHLTVFPSQREALMIIGYMLRSERHVYAASAACHELLKDFIPSMQPELCRSATWTAGGDGIVFVTAEEGRAALNAFRDTLPSRVQIFDVLRTWEPSWTLAGNASDLRAGVVVTPPIAGADGFDRPCAVGGASRVVRHIRRIQGAVNAYPSRYEQSVHPMLVARESGAQERHREIGSVCDDLRRVVTRNYVGADYQSLDSARNMMLARGTQNFLAHILAALPHTAVLVPRLALPFMTRCALLVGADVVEYELTPKGPRLTQPVRRGDVRAVWINSPVNPTGNILDDAHAEALALWCVENGAPLIHDCDINFLTRGRSIPSFWRASEQLQWLQIHTFAKELGLPLEFAFVMGSTGMIDVARARLAHCGAVPARFKIDALEEALGTLLAKDGAESIESQLRRVDDVVATAHAALLEMGFRVIAPAAGIRLLARVPSRWSPGPTMRTATSRGERFAELLLREARVIVTPGICFSQSLGNWVRFVIDKDEETTAEMLRRIRGVIAAVRHPLQSPPCSNTSP